MDYLEYLFNLNRATVGGMDTRALKGGIHKATGGTGGYDGAEKRASAFMSSLPIVGDIIRQVDNDRYWSDYLANRGMTWADVKYPGRLGYGQMSSTINFVSRNITNLYGPADEFDKAQTKLDDFL